MLGVYTVYCGGCSNIHTYYVTDKYILYIVQISPHTTSEPFQELDPQFASAQGGPLSVAPLYYDTRDNDPTKKAVPLATSTSTLEYCSGMAKKVCFGDVPSSY